MIADQATALRGLVRSASEDSSRLLTVPAQTAEPADAVQTQRPAGFARTLAVTSGKGGVGKTTVSVNLAIQLARLNRRVMLLDADLGTANVDVLCDLSPTTTLAHVVAGRRSIEDAIIDAPGGFELIPGASGLAQMANLSEIERVRLMQQMRQIEARADLMLIDTGAGVGPNVLSFAVAADEVLVVTTPEPTAITDAYAVIKTICRQKDDPDIRILVNMVRDEREGRAVFERMRTVCRRFLNLSPKYAGHLVSDPRVQLSVRSRRPFVLDHPTGLAGSCMYALAHRLDRHVAAPPAGGLLRRMSAWLLG